MDIKSQATCMFLPNSNFVVIWEILFSIFVIFYFGLSLMALTFSLQEAMTVSNIILVSIIILALCIVDTIVSWHIKTIQNGKLLSNRKQNLRKYLRSKLFYSDALVIIILIIKIILTCLNAYQQTLTIIDLFILLKFYNIYLYQKRLKFYYFRQRNLLIFQFCKYLVVLGFLCHVVGCIYFYIDAELIKAGWYPIADHWLITSQALNGIYYQPLGIQYLYSFYVSLVTLSTVAYGDITPMNPTQTIFIMFVLSFLLLLYAYIFTQIYEVVTFYNRQQIQIREEKIRMVNYLNKYRKWINSKLKGKIIAQFEYGSRKIKKTKKDVFFDDLNGKLKNKYNETMFTQKVDLFIPHFIKRAGLSAQQFNSIIIQQFYVNNQPFNSFSNNLLLNSEYINQERKMFYVANTKIIRRLHRQDNIIAQYARQNCWLGLNYFVTSQIDFNQSWDVESPIELLTIKFKHFKELLKSVYNSYEKYLNEFHQILYMGGTAQDMQKCLLCNKQFHNSLHCQAYRPKIGADKLTGNEKNKRNKKFRRKSTPFNFKQLIWKKNSQKYYEKEFQTQVQTDEHGNLIAKEEQEMKYSLKNKIAEQSDQLLFLTFPKFEFKGKMTSKYLQIQNFERYRQSTINLTNRIDRLTKVRQTYNNITARKTYLFSQKSILNEQEYKQYKIDLQIQRISWRGQINHIDQAWSWRNYLPNDNIFC